MTNLDLNPPIASGEEGGVIYPQTDLFNGISEPLGIKWNGLVTFPSNGWATQRRENYCPVLHRKSNMAAGNRNMRLKFFVDTLNHVEM